MPVRFHFQSPITLSDRTRLKVFLEGICRREARKASDLSFIFLSDKELLNMNRQYLKHNYYTDIITFDLSDPQDTTIIGEIYISTDRVRENAALYRSSIRQELHRVIFHGVLHLCGFKDKKPSEIKAMRSKEDYYLARYF